MLKIISLLLLVGIFAQPVSAARPKPSPSPDPTIKKVCVDAGHGGSDTGAIYQNLVERDINLDIAQRLKSLLKEDGFTVVMTRSNNSTELGNSDRANICNAAGANYLISVHLNGSTNHSINYTLGLYGKQGKDKTWAQKINNAMGSLGIPNNGITNFANGMLLKANMPATIAETVFITSNAEYSLLSDGTGNRQQQIAQALFNGITSP